MTDHNNIKADVDAFLADNGITYAVRYIGETTRDKWECDQWRVTLTGKSAKIETDYFTGLGHRSPMPKPKDGGPMPRKGTLMYDQLERQRKPIAPRAADVLCLLILDASTVDMSFVDWCADYGYNDDSRKALATYEACCQVGHDLRKLLTHDHRETLREMLQDY